MHQLNFQINILLYSHKLFIWSPSWNSSLDNSFILIQAKVNLINCINHMGSDLAEAATAAAAALILSILNLLNLLPYSTH